MMHLLCYQKFIIQSEHCIVCDFYLKKISNLDKILMNRRKK